MKTAGLDLLDELRRLDERVTQYDAHIQMIARADEHTQTLMEVPGIGPTTASALLASIGNGHDFANGRQLVAWLGLVPGQYSSGCKQRLGRITKAGDSYLRTLLILGARAVLARSMSRQSWHDSRGNYLDMLRAFGGRSLRRRCNGLLAPLPHRANFCSATKLNKNLHGVWHKGGS